MNKRQYKKIYKKQLKEYMYMYVTSLKDHYERDCTIQEIHATLRLLEKDPNNIKMIFYDTE